MLRLAPPARLARLSRPLDLRVAIGMLAFSALVLCVFRMWMFTPRFTDLKVYRAEGLALRDGLNLYGPLPGVTSLATYPPFAALIFVPASFVPIPALKVLGVALNLVLLVLVCWQSARLMDVPARAAVVPACAFAAFAIWAEPVFTTFSYGQINLLLLALVLWDFTRPADSRLRGVGTGIATGLKVTPGILIVYLLLTRRLRAAATAVGAWLLTIGVSAAVDPGAVKGYWTKYLFDSHRVGRLENAVNQTIRGWLVRADHTRHTRPTELILVAIVLVLGLACSVLAYRWLGEPWGVLAAAVTGLLCSPISWSHHWVYCVPIAVLLWYRERSYVLPTLIVFCSFCVWYIPHKHSVELHFNGWQIAVSGWYVLYGLGFLALAAWRVRQTAQR